MHPLPAELQAHADGEPTDGRVAAHVASCAECRAEIAAVRRVTAGLILGSKAPDSLTAKIRARRAVRAHADPLLTQRARRARSRENFMVPAGLLAAAALALFVPRAWREQASDARTAPIGAKGGQRVELAARETIVTETGATSIDSVSWDVSGPGTTAELRYVTGLAETPGAERLAERIAQRLVEAGVDRSAISVRRVPFVQDDVPLPAGAVGITLRRLAP